MRTVETVADLDAATGGAIIVPLDAAWPPAMKMGGRWVTCGTNQSWTGEAITHVLPARVVWEGGENQ